MKKELTETAKKYSDQWAHDYDLLEVVTAEETQETVDAIANYYHGLDSDRPVLEVAAGTGRIAIPLAKKEINIVASDASEEMLSILSSKDVDNLVKTRVDILPYINGNESYGIILILMNSIWAINDFNAQKKFVKNAYDRLEENGLLIVEMGLADPRRWIGKTKFEINDSKVERTTDWNPLNSKMTHRFDFIDRNESRQVDLRSLSPSELDLMAETAGFTLFERRFEWKKEVSESEATQTISVYRK